jgi:hypothetical protein
MFVAFFGTTTKMHDIYAYGLGLYTLIATVLLTEFTAEKTTLLVNQERKNIKRGLLIGGIRLAKWTYLLIFGGILLPLLCGVCLDLYVMMPFKRLVSPGSKVEIAVMQDWAFGVIHLKIAGRIILYLDGRLAHAMRNVPHPLPLLFQSTFTNFRFSQDTGRIQMYDLRHEYSYSQYSNS